MHVHMDSSCLSTCFFDAPHDLPGGLRFQQGGHIFYAKRVATKINQLLSQINKVRCRMKWADGVADRALSVLARASYRCHRTPHVANVIQCIKDTENVDSVLCRVTREYRYAINDRADR